MDNNKFNYQLLDRLRSDCDYFLGNGNRCENRLEYGSIKKHIETMKELWNNFTEDMKPEWLTYEEIENYESKMLGGNEK